MNTVDQDLELQVYLPDEEVPTAPDSDLAAEEPKEEAVAEVRPNGRADGQARREETTVGEAADAVTDGAPSGDESGFDLLEDLTPYELRTICQSVANLRQPASFIEIYGSIRDLDERGELELTQDEIREVVEAMLETGFLEPTRTKPYEEAKAHIVFYALDRDREEVKAALKTS